MAYDAALNARIVAWLQARPLGSRHGNGECWTLAEDALISAGARTSRQLTPHFSAGADYVWGDEETNFSDIHPGDIVQLSGYRATLTTTLRNFIYPQGRIQQPIPTISRPHHTAIVLRVIVPSSLVEVIEQNAARLPVGGVPQPARVVQINRLALRSVTGSTETRQSDSGDSESTTVTYAVLDGQIRVYHPRPR